MNTKPWFKLIMLLSLVFIPGIGIDNSAIIDPSGLVPAASFYLVKDIVPGAASSDPHVVATLDPGVSLLFGLCDGGSDCYTRLYRSDGSAAGTDLVKDFGEGATQISSYAMLDDILYFFVDGWYGSTCEVAGFWKSDGTEAGTERLLCFPPEGMAAVGLLPVGGKLFFLVVGKYFDGKILWVSDGSSEGTKELKYFDDFYPAIFMMEMNGELYLIKKVHYGQFHWQLWTSDGTVAGTREIKTISYDLDANVYLQGMASLEGILYFSAIDNEHGQELWRSDGTEAGTWLVADLNPGISSSDPLWLTGLDGILYFVATGEAGLPGLWRSDGSQEGTYQLRPFKDLSQLLPFQQETSWLYFTADDGEKGTELWKSDGTPTGTAMVKDIALGEVSSSPSQLLRVNDLLYFAAENEANGRELWVSDGTEAGTQLAYDLIPGAGSSSPEYLHHAGDKVFFSAADGLHGRELWAFFIDPKFLYFPLINR